MPRDNPTLENALQQMELQALNFAYRWCKDSNVRQMYISRTQAMSRELRAAHASGGMTAKSAAKAANELRNEIMELARVRSSDIGRAKARQLKAKGLSFDDLKAKYAKKMFGVEFDRLGTANKNAVYLEIVDSAGRANPKVSAKVGRLGAAGRGLWVFTAVIAIYNVGNAEYKCHQAGRELACAGGGFGGGAAGGALAGVWFGPVGVAVGVIVGGVLGSVIADEAYVELTGPREAEVRRFLPRYTAMFSVDEAGIANALVREYGINMDRVFPVFCELNRSYSSDADDVARLFIHRVRRTGGLVEHALRLHGALRQLLVEILEDGWTSSEERNLINYLSR